MARPIVALEGREDVLRASRTDKHIHDAATVERITAALQNGAPYGRWAIMLCAEVAAARSSVATWLSSPKGALTNGGGAVMDHASAWITLLSHESAEARAATAMLCGCVAPLGLEGLEQLIALGHDDPHPAVRSSAVIALSRLGEDADAARQAVVAATATDDDGPLLQGALALARARLDPECGVLSQTDLTTWLSSRTATSHGAVFPWFVEPSEDLKVGDALLIRPEAIGIVALAVARDQRAQLLDALASLAIEPGHVVLRDNIEVSLVWWAGLADRKAGTIALTADELSPTQRQMTERLADSALFPSARYGVVACGSPRRRLLGLEPPGVADQPVANRDGAQVPRWRAVLDHRDADTEGNLFAPEVIEGLERDEIVELLLLIDENMYGGYIRVEETPPEYTPSDPVAFVNAQRDLIDDFAKRAAAQKPLAKCGRTFSAVLVPYMKAGGELEDGWRLLFGMGDAEAFAEALDALPESQRNRTYIDVLLRYPDFGDGVYGFIELPRGVPEGEEQPIAVVWSAFVEHDLPHMRLSIGDAKSMREEVEEAMEDSDLPTLELPLPESPPIAVQLPVLKAAAKKEPSKPKPDWRFAKETPLRELRITAVRRKQLAVLDEAYFRDVASASILDMRNATEGDEAFWADNTSLWQVKKGRKLVYEAYMYGADGGTVFEAGTTNVVAEIIQRRLQAHDAAAGEALSVAYETSDLSSAGTFTLRIR